MRGTERGVVNRGMFIERMKECSKYSRDRNLRFASDEARTDNLNKRILLLGRVRSWLRMNAGGRLNTCKSNGKARSSNTEGTRVAHGCVTRMQPAPDRDKTAGNGC